jgi:hypothetical protein
MNARLGLPQARRRTAAAIVFLFIVASTLLQLQSSALEQSTRDPDTITDKVNWSDFAYTQYVTNTNYLCNSVMLFETLDRLKSKADRLMLYPDSFSTEQDSLEGSLLRKARDDYGVKLVPVQVQIREGVECTFPSIGPLNQLLLMPSRKLIIVQLRGRRVTRNSLYSTKPSISVFCI